MMISVLLAVSCIEDEYEGPDPNLPSRTVLFYIAGDNNLGEVGRIAELLRQGWTYTGNRCLIYYDAPNSAPKLLSLRGGCSVMPTPYIETVAEYPEENSASAEVLSRVIHDVVSKYPADSYGLIFTSHSSGWLPEGMLANAQRSNRSIGSDRNPGTMADSTTEMELADFASAIPDHQFDFIIFESCLMAGVEVAYELRNKTDYLLASSAEMLSPGYLAVYPDGSKYLFDTHYGTQTTLRMFALSYMEYINQQSGLHRSATQSIIHTKRLDEMAATAREVFGGMAPSTRGCDVTNIQHFDRPGSYGDTPASPRYFDFGEYMEQRATPAQYAAMSALLNEIVVWKAETAEFMLSDNGFTIRRHCGLTTYIEQPKFPSLNTAYSQTSWYRAIRINE